MERFDKNYAHVREEYNNIWVNIPFDSTSLGFFSFDFTYLEILLGNSIYLWFVLRAVPCIVCVVRLFLENYL